MFARFLAVLSLLAIVAGATPADEPKSDKKAREALDKKIAELKAPQGGQIIEVTDEPVTRSFPKHAFFVLRYRQYPVPLPVPEPLKHNNVFVVKPDNSVEHLTEAKALEKFFAAMLAKVEKGEDAKAAAKAWLRLSQEFHQDGFFQFSVSDDLAVTMTKDLPPSTIEVSGKATVEEKRGDKGELTATLVFQKGKLDKVTEKANLKAGVRPICQATKLLDPDPIVRAMAEQSLVVMGSAAKAYLDEQRAKASRELQNAIDRVWRRIVDEGR